MHTDSKYFNSSFELELKLNILLFKGSDMSSRVNITSRRTLSESSEAEGTVTYNRELFLPGLGPAGHLPRGGEHSQHVSPTGSEVI